MRTSWSDPDVGPVELKVGHGGKYGVLGCSYPQSLVVKMGSFILWVIVNKSPDLFRTIRNHGPSARDLKDHLRFTNAETRGEVQGFIILSFILLRLCDTEKGWMEEMSRRQTLQS